MLNIFYGNFKQSYHAKMFNYTCKSHEYLKKFHGKSFYYFIKNNDFVKNYKKV